MDDKKETLKKNISAVEDEIKRLERESQERAEKEIDLDDEINLKSRLTERDILEAQDKKKRPETAIDEEKPGTSIISPAFRPQIGSPATTQTRGSSGIIATPRIQPISALTLEGIVGEVVGRRVNAAYEHKGRQSGIKFQDIFMRMWGVEQWGEGKKEMMLRDLGTIEGRTASRITRMNSLNLAKLDGQITISEKEELKKLQQEEVDRYWMRQALISNLPLREQEQMNWLRPIGEGAYGVMPHAYVSKWELLTTEQRRGVRWLYDNTLLRWQRAITGKFQPRAARLPWFKATKKGAIERQFDDLNEELYSDKKFAELVKKGTAQLEKFEDEIMADYRFTAEEESRIQKMFAATMKKELVLAEEPDLYG